jgi:hypothetical protein
MDMRAERMNAQVEPCQQAILRALIGFEVPTIMASLTTITGAMIAQQARTKPEARMLARTVARGIASIAEESAGKVPNDV